MEAQRILQLLDYNDSHPDDKRCLICNVPVRKGNTCGYSCMGKLTVLSRSIRVTKICPICGDIFYTKIKERHHITCNKKECVSSRISIINKGRDLGGGNTKGEHNGYIRIHKIGHPNAESTGSISEHRYIMSEILGRPLQPYEIVHHKDGNKKNNSPENLELMTRGNHQKMHAINQNQPRGEDGKFLNTIKRASIKI